MLFHKSAKSAFAMFVAMAPLMVTACAETPEPQVDSSSRSTTQDQQSQQRSSGDATTQVPSQLVNADEIQSGYVIRVGEDVLDASHFIIIVRNSEGKNEFFKAMPMPPAGTVIGVPFQKQGLYTVVVKAYNQPAQAVINQVQTQASISESLKVVKLTFAPSKNAKDLIAQE